MSKISVQIYRAKNYAGDIVEGQLLIIDKTPTIIRFTDKYEEPDLTFDGHHIYQQFDAPLWVDPSSVEFVCNREIELTY